MMGWSTYSFSTLNLMFICCYDSLSLDGLEFMHQRVRQFIVSTCCNTSYFSSVEIESTTSDFEVSVISH